MELGIAKDDASQVPVLGFDADGDGIAVWEVIYGSGLEQLWASHFTPDVGWTSFGPISSPGNNNDLRLAVGGDGSGIVLWNYSPGSGQGSSVTACRYDPESGWGSPEALASGLGAAPVIVANASGVAIAAWKKSAPQRIESIRFSPEGGWGSIETINSGGSGGVANPALACNADGYAMAAWEQFDGTSTSIAATSFDPAAGWSDSQYIEALVPHASLPSLTMDANGNVLAAWLQTQGGMPVIGGDNVWSNRFVFGTGWGNEVIIETATGDATELTVVGDPEGNAIAAWRQYDGLEQSIMANRFEPATGWSQMEWIETAALTAGTVKIAMSADGSALVVWRHYEILGPSPSPGSLPPPATWNIWSNRFDPTTGWETPRLLETSNAVASSPAVAMDSEGNGSVFWRYNPSDSTTVWTSRYE